MWPAGGRARTAAWTSCGSTVPRITRHIGGGDRVGAQAGEHVGDRGVVAQRAEDAEHAPGGDRGEEVLEVEPQDARLTRVQPGVADDRAASREAVGRVVDGDVVEDLAQDPALDLLEARLRGFDDPRQPAPAADRAVAVVAQSLIGDRALEAAHVGQPGELSVAQLEAFGQLGDRVDRGDRPAVLEPRPSTEGVRERLARGRSGERRAGGSGARQRSPASRRGRPRSARPARRDGRRAASGGRPRPAAPGPSSSSASDPDTRPRFRP